MHAIKLTILAAAVVVGIPAASGFAAERFGRYTVYLQSGADFRDTPITVEVKGFGGDSVFIAKDTILVRANTINLGNVAFKPGA